MEIQILCCAVQSTEQVHFWNAYSTGKFCGVALGNVDGLLGVCLHTYGFQKGALEHPLGISWHFITLKWILLKQKLLECKYNNFNCPYFAMATFVWVSVLQIFRLAVSALSQESANAVNNWDKEDSNKKSQSLQDYAWAVQKMGIIGR